MIEVEANSLLSLSLSKSSHYSRMAKFSRSGFRFWEKNLLTEWRTYLVDPGDIGRHPKYCHNVNLMLLINTIINCKTTLHPTDSDTH